MKIFSWNNRPPTTFESGGRTSRIEIAGYRSAEERIKALILAGQRLVEARREEFDGEGDLDDIEIDPTRRPGYDLADATEAMHRLRAKKKKPTPIPPSVPDLKAGEPQELALEGK